MDAEQSDMTLEELYKKGTYELEKAGIENPSVDAFYLLEYAAGLNKTKYLMFKDQPVNDRNITQYMGLIEQRASRIPYQYITGTADFAGLTFEVTPDVLIPRLDTEVLFEQALRKLKYKACVLDLCTGSGALGIALKRYRPDIHVVMSEISDEALEVAERNAGHNHLGVIWEDDSEAALDYNIRLIKSDLFDDITGAAGRFDLIVSNPPYVSESEYEELMPEVRLHEPKLALVSGPEGLDHYSRIAAGAAAFMKDDGVLMLEIGCSQAEAVSAMLAENGFKNIEIIKDLAGLDRVVSCVKG